MDHFLYAPARLQYFLIKDNIQLYLETHAKRPNHKYDIVCCIMVLVWVDNIINDHGPLLLCDMRRYVISSKLSFSENSLLFGLRNAQE